MTKIKVVQIAMSEADDSIYTEYLDDQGRVWYDDGKVTDDPEHTGRRTWVTEWKQLDLPEEPEV